MNHFREVKQTMHVMSAKCSPLAYKLVDEFAYIFKELDNQAPPAVVIKPEVATLGFPLPRLSSQCPRFWKLLWECVSRRVRILLMN